MDNPAGLMALAYLGKQAVNFLRTVGGPAMGEFALLLQDPVREYRARRAARLLQRSAEMAQAGGGAPQQVHPRILLPLIDAASVEDDQGLSEMWAALLANAASTDGHNRVAPSFPFILRQLSPLDASILDFLHRRGATRAAGTSAEKRFRTGRRDRVRPSWGLTKQQLLEGITVASETSVEIAMNHLVGLGLIEIEPLLRAIEFDQDIVHMPTENSDVRLSALGAAFAVACAPPDTEYPSPPTPDGVEPG